MFFRVLAGYKDVVKIDEHRRDITKDAIHQPLKGLCSILETEGHTEEFPEAKRCDDSRFGDILGCHWYLVVAADEVNFREDCRACKVVVEVLDVGEWVAVIHRHVVEAAEITTGPPAPTRFPNDV